MCLRNVIPPWKTSHVQEQIECANRAAYYRCKKQCASTISLVLKANPRSHPEHRTKNKICGCAFKGSARGKIANHFEKGYVCSSVAKRFNTARKFKEQLSPTENRNLQADAEGLLQSLLPSVVLELLLARSGLVVQWQNPTQCHSCDCDLRVLPGNCNTNPSTRNAFGKKQAVKHFEGSRGRLNKRAVASGPAEPVHPVRKQRHACVEGGSALTSRSCKKKAPGGLGWLHDGLRGSAKSFLRASPSDTKLHEAP